MNIDCFGIFLIFLNCFNSAPWRKKIFSLKTCELLSVLCSKGIIVLQYSEYFLNCPVHLGARKVLFIDEYFWTFHCTLEQENHCFGMFGHFELMSAPGSQSVTSRLETSRYRDFSQFFESIGLGLKNFGLEKKSRYRSRWNLLVSSLSAMISSTQNLSTFLILSIYLSAALVGR